MILAIVLGTVAIPALLVLFVLLAGKAHAAGIPQAAQQHRRELVRLARQEWGLDANVSLAAAQIHQESGWRADARSPYATGMAQFTPETAAWIVTVYPDLGEAAPLSSSWSMRALLRYDAFLYRRILPVAMAECDRRAMQLSAYNGGEGRLITDRRLAQVRGADPDRWWDNVELHSTRSRAAFQENRGYPRRILRDLEPLYVQAGWPGRLTC